MDIDFMFYIHEGEDYINIATSEAAIGTTMTKEEGKMLIKILQTITNRAK